MVQITKRDIDEAAVALAIEWGQQLSEPHMALPGAQLIIDTFVNRADNPRFAGPTLSKAMNQRAAISSGLSRHMERGELSEITDLVMAGKYKGPHANRLDPDTVAKARAAVLESVLNAALRKGYRLEPEIGSAAHYHSPSKYTEGATAEMAAQGGPVASVGNKLVVGYRDAPDKAIPPGSVVLSKEVIDELDNRGMLDSFVYTDPSTWVAGFPSLERFNIRERLESLIDEDAVLGKPPGTPGPTDFFGFELAPVDENNMTRYSTHDAPLDGPWVALRGQVTGDPIEGGYGPPPTDEKKADNRNALLPRPKPRLNVEPAKPLAHPGQTDRAYLDVLQQRLSATAREPAGPEAPLIPRPKPISEPPFIPPTQPNTGTLPRPAVIPKRKPRNRTPHNSQLLYSRPPKTALAQSTIPSDMDMSRPAMRVGPVVDPTGRPSALRRQLMYRALIGEFGV